MKKLISLTLAILMVLSLSVPAMAKTYSDTENTTNVAVTYTADSAYTITIPADVSNLNWSENAQSVGEVELTQLNIAPGKKITVTQKLNAVAAEGVEGAENALSHADDLKVTIGATLDNATALDVTMAAWTATTAVAKHDTKITLSGIAKAASGTYKGVITFTATVA